MWTLQPIDPDVHTVQVWPDQNLIDFEHPNAHPSDLINPNQPNPSSAPPVVGSRVWADIKADTTTDSQAEPLCRHV